VAREKLLYRLMEIRLNKFDLMPEPTSAGGNFETIKNISVSMYHILFIVFVATLTILFPTFWLLFILPLTVVSLCLAFSPFYFGHLSQARIIVPFLEILQKLSILKFFVTLHSLVFYTKTKVYLWFLFGCHGLTLFYILLSRYYFYHTVILKEVFSFDTIGIVTIGLIIGFFGSYLRILITFSQLIIFFARKFTPEELPSLLRVDPHDFPQAPNRSIFHYSKNINNYHRPLPKNAHWGKAGFFLGFGSLVISGATYYHVAQQTEEARIQTLEFRTQNDLEEVSQGLKTKEEYLATWSKK